MQQKANWRERPRIRRKMVMATRGIRRRRSTSIQRRKMRTPSETKIVLLKN
jgi:hypothetical protein